MIHGKLTYVGLAIALGYVAGACSSDTTAATPPAEGGAGTGTGGSSGGGGSGSGGKPATGGGAGMGGGGTMGGGAGGGAAGSSAEAGAKPTCSSYCDAIMANCTGGDGSDGGKTNQQYSAKSNCMAICALFPAGKAGDTTGDSLACRAYHADAAKSSKNPTLHCPHAGPGGDGQCGDVCPAYCRMVTNFCQDKDAGIYKDNAACLARCNATPHTERFNIGIQQADQHACLLYHAQEAPISGAADHCLGDLTPTDSGTGSVTCHN